MYTIFYVYVYLDPRKSGNYMYGNYSFEYEPFYVGKGCNDRSYHHLCESHQKQNSNKSFINKIKKIQKEIDTDPIIMIYKKNMSENESYELEKKLIDMIGRKDLKKGPLCNLTDGGEGGGTGRIVSDEVKQKLIINNMMGITGMKGKKHTEISKQKIRESNIGRTHTNETKQRMSNKAKGHIVSDETKEKLRQYHLGKKHTIETIQKIKNHSTKSFKGKHHTEETKQRMSELHKGKVFTEEHKRKLSESRIGSKRNDETKQRMSEAQKGHSVSQETRQKISESLHNRRNK